ncbi:MAG: DUF1186 domain-containing protein [Lachnospiraceae bacterium]|nr:DUF1186 domain-containing protein [Lachnospiraceae bacterium]
MNTLQEALETITWLTNAYPKEAMDVIRANKDAAIPYLRAALQKALCEQDDLADAYELHFYALFLLGEFQDRGSFPLIMQLAVLPEETLDQLIGGAITEGLNNILYNTYDGNLQLLEQAVWNTEADDFARAAFLSVMGQLYLDGSLPKEDWQNFLRQIIYSEEEIGDYIYSEIALEICDCHMLDMLPDIRQLFKDNRIDVTVHGEYCDHVDAMFDYNKPYRQKLCTSPMSADTLKNWAMYEQPPRERKTDQDWEKLLEKAARNLSKPEPKVKIGRNDPCPCGSGKKYKFCCLNKAPSGLDLIESASDRKKWLKEYPETDKNRQEGRLYLADYYDSEAIEIDQIVYLALHHRSGRPIWDPEPKFTQNKRTLLYLNTAFEKFLEKVEKEGIQTLQEYDKRHSIHFTCAEWLDVLRNLSEESGDQELSRQVKHTMETMNAALSH